MKPSHYVTPRTMADGCWIASADPIDFDHRRTPHAWHVTDFVLAALAVGTLAAIFLGVL